MLPKPRKSSSKVKNVGLKNNLWQIIKKTRAMILVFFMGFLYNKWIAFEVCLRPLKNQPS